MKTHKMLIIPTSSFMSDTLRIELTNPRVGVDTLGYSWVRKGIQGELVWWEADSRRLSEGDYYLGYEVG